MPSKYELNELYAQKAVVGGFADDYYWSSIQDDSNYAWYQYFKRGARNDGSKDYAFRVRAVRAF